MSEVDPPCPSGRAIATLRTTDGWTQSQLARRANLPLSLLSTVETGERAATHALWAAVARALKVPVHKLSGQPYHDLGKDKRTHRAIDALRSALRRYDPPDDLPPRPLEELAADVAEAARLRQAADYAKLAARLPALLEQLITAAHHADAAHTAKAHFLLVSAYHTAHPPAGLPRPGGGIEHPFTLSAHRADDPLAGAWRGGPGRNPSNQPGTTHTAYG